MFAESNDFVKLFNQMTIVMFCRSARTLSGMIMCHCVVVISLIILPSKCPRQKVEVVLRQTAGVAVAFGRVDGEVGEQVVANGVADELAWHLLNVSDQEIFFRLLAVVHRVVGGLDIFSDVKNDAETAPFANCLSLAIITLDGIWNEHDNILYVIRDLLFFSQRQVKLFCHEIAETVLILEEEKLLEIADKSVWQHIEILLFSRFTLTLEASREPVNVSPYAQSVQEPFSIIKSECPDAASDVLPFQDTVIRVQIFCSMQHHQIPVHVA